MKYLTHKLFPILQIFLIYILPVILLYTGIIPVGQRLWLIFPVTGLIVYSAIKDKFSLKDLGIRLDNIKSCFIPYLIFTLFGVGLVFLFIKISGKTALNEYWNFYHFQGLFILVSAFQEFAFRGYLMPKLQSLIKSGFWVIITNSLLFMLLHIIFPYPELTLPLAFIAGLGFAAIYKLYPNLILITILHSVLNFIAVLYCFFSFNNSC